MVLMCYANLVFARGVERFADELAERGISGLIVPDLPLEEARRRARRLRRARASRSSRSSRRRRRDERLAAIGAGARGFVYTVVGDRHDGRARGRRRRTAPTSSRARKAAHRRARRARLRHRARRRTPRAAADAGADGVIVGSRLVRAAAEARGARRPRGRASWWRGLAAALAGRIRAHGPPAHHRSPPPSSGSCSGLARRSTPF